MAKTKVVKFLVDEEHFKKIKSNASLKGHKTVSSYLRELSLNSTFQQEYMLSQIYNKIMENKIKTS